MPAPNWSVLGRSAARYLWDRTMRCLYALGSMSTGVSSPDWWRSSSEHWWEGVATTRETGVKAVIESGRVEPGGLNDPRVLRTLRGLRGSQDLTGLGERTDSAADAAPHWHPERRVGG